MGLGYHYERRTDWMAFLEPVGTAVVGALVGWLIISPVAVRTLWLGVVTVNPAPSTLYLGLFGGPLFLVASFALSSVSGALLGFFCVKALRRAGVLPRRPGAA